MAFLFVTVVARVNYVVNDLIASRLPKAPHRLPLLHWHEPQISASGSARHQYAYDRSFHRDAVLDCGSEVL
jgi:hypothetical protein